MIAAAQSSAPAFVDRSKDPNCYRVFSFGGGVQSIMLLEYWLFDSIVWVEDAANIHGFKGFFDGEKPDLVVFADTQAEPKHVYEAIKDARALCEAAGVRFEVVTEGNLARPEPASTGTQGIFVPVYTRKLFTDEDGPAGKLGQLYRQCTSRYKIDPVAKLAKSLAGDRTIEITLAVSLEEAHRMHKAAPDDQIQYRYPLIFQQMGNVRGLTRNDLLNELVAYEMTAAKSACVFCPYRRDPWWADMYRNDPESFAAAVEYDEWVRHLRPGFECYIHDSREPLAIAVPKIVALAEQQGSLFPLSLDTSSSGGCNTGPCGT